MSFSQPRDSLHEVVSFSKARQKYPRKKGTNDAAEISWIQAQKDCTRDLETDGSELKVDPYVPVTTVIGTFEMLKPSRVLLRLSDTTG
jgi:hypothetical protein